jgi:hypothetical protein
LTAGVVRNDSTFTPYPLSAGRNGNVLNAEKTLQPNNYWVVTPTVILKPSFLRIFTVHLLCKNACNFLAISTLIRQGKSSDLAL